MKLMREVHVGVLFLLLCCRHSLRGRDNGAFSKVQKMSFSFSFNFKLDEALNFKQTLQPRVYQSASLFSQSMRSFAMRNSAKREGVPGLSCGHACLRKEISRLTRRASRVEAVR